MAVVRQYQVVVVNLDPTQGSEIRKTRPCVIISPDEMNKHLKTVVIAPITSASKQYPTRIEVKVMGKRGWVVIDQVRTIDKSRIIKQGKSLSKAEIQAVKEVLRETFVD